MSYLWVESNYFGVHCAISNQNFSCAFPSFAKKCTIFARMEDLSWKIVIFTKILHFCPEWHPWVLHWGGGLFIWGLQSFCDWLVVGRIPPLGAKGAGKKLATFVVNFPFGFQSDRPRGVIVCSKKWLTGFWSREVTPPQGSGKFSCSWTLEMQILAGGRRRHVFCFFPWPFPGFCWKIFSTWKSTKAAQFFSETKFLVFFFLAFLDFVASKIEFFESGFPKNLLRMHQIMWLHDEKNFLGGDSFSEFPAESVYPGQAHMANQGQPGPP